MEKSMTGDATGCAEGDFNPTAAGHLDADTLSMIELAYLGDGIYEMAARNRVLQQYQGHKIAKLHREVVSLVNCHSQADALTLLLPILSDAEAEIVRRGRNASSKTPRNANPSDYKRATALEALLGYLYLKGETGRMQCLLELCLG
jgi:ribonuclease-3 family protein